MDIETGAIDGLKLIRLKVFEDNRGFFIERFSERQFKAAGIPTSFVQDNHSRSAPRVIRGLHFQFAPAQGKLVGCVRGRIWDVVVDMRADSPTFGQNFMVELSEKNGLLLWIPAGFAHGFCVMGDEPADVVYKVDSYYNPAGEVGIRYDDPDLAIAWPVKDPILSERDRSLPSWKDCISKPIRWERSS